MKLTIAALTDMQSTCAAIEGFTGLSNLEKGAEMAEEAMELRQTITALVGTLSDLSENQKFLVKNGFSDEWFEFVNRNQKFENLVSLDMPKFFKDPAGKKEACLEAIGQTIIAWLKKAWEIVKRIFVWLYSVLRQVKGIWEKVLGEQISYQHKIIDKVEKASDAVIEEVLKLANNQMQVTDPAVMNSISMGFMGAVMVLWRSKNWLGDVDTSLKQNEIPAAVMTKITQELAADGIKIIDFKNTGYRITNNGFLFVDPKTLGKVNYQLTDKDSLLKVLNDIGGISNTFLRYVKTLDDVAANAKEMQDALQKKVNEDIAAGAVSTTHIELMEVQFLSKLTHDVLSFGKQMIQLNVTESRRVTDLLATMK